MEINSLIESAGLGHVERILRQNTDYTTIVTINESGERYVLKLSDKSQYDRRYREFEYLKLMSESGINCLQPLGVNSIKGDTIAMYSFVNGEPLLTKISSYDSNRVFTLGSRAGMFLKSIHKCIKFDSSTEEENIYKRTNVIENYKNGGLHFDKKIEEKIFKFLNSFDSSFKHEKVFCHGNFSIFNIIEMENHDISILHFDDFYIGDPYSDFSKMIYQNRISTNFSNGIINGYFNNNVPKDFFKYYYYYGCLELLESINAKDYSSQSIAASEFLYNSSDFTLNSPKWYNQKSK